MTYKLIKTDSYLYIISDEETSEVDKITIGDKPKTWYYYNNKILAHLPLNNSPILQGVDLLLPLKQEDDVEKLAEIYVCGGIYLTESEKQQTEVAYMSGYTQCQEDMADKKYTEEDMLLAYVSGGTRFEENKDANKLSENFKELINLLNKQD